jgi:transcriptional regulator with XRE-family HTH domain
MPIFLLAHTPTRRSEKPPSTKRAVSHVQYTTTLSILNCTNAGDAGGEVLHVAHRFERFLDIYRRPDGRRWSGQAIDEATDGIVTRSYITNLRKGRIENPGYGKMRAISKAMGFPPEMWFEEDLGSEGGSPPRREGRGITGRVEHLFEVVKNPTTGESYTSAEVARMSAGELSEEEVEGIRSGKIADPTVGRVAALAAVFGVPPSYMLDRGTGSEVFDEEVLDALADETADAILRKSARLPEREKEIVLGIVRQFSDQLGAGER